MERILLINSSTLNLMVYSYSQQQLLCFHTVRKVVDEENCYLIKKDSFQFLLTELLRQCQMIQQLMYRAFATIQYQP